MSVNGQRDSDLRAASRRRSNVERAAMPLDDMFDDGEAETGAAGFSAPGRIDPIEALGKPGQMLWSNSVTAIADGQQYASSAVGPHSDFRRAGFFVAAVTKRVADEVVG